MSFDEFDAATPRMVQLFITAYGKRAEQQQAQQIIAAWHGERFAIAAQVEPGLGVDDLQKALSMGKAEPPAPVTWEQERRRWDAFFACIPKVQVTDGR